MGRIAYKETRFSAASEARIHQANVILAEYQDKGFDLTLRQLYYQFVARGLIDNNQREYKNLGSLVNDARLAGRIDWNSIVDRTRDLRGRPHWANPADIVKACAQSFSIDLWEGQPVRPEVWIEKDALVGVIEPVCRSLDVSYFSCRGYVSQSEMHEAAHDRIAPRESEDQRTVILHLGDHDPSGIDMTRDIEDRLLMFGCNDLEVLRIALTMEQVQEFNPPPNPAKLSDARAQGYVDKYGDESWELDALSPETIAELITKHVASCLKNPALHKKMLKREKDMKASLAKTSKHWPTVETYVKTLKDLK